MVKYILKRLALYYKSFEISLQITYIKTSLIGFLISNSYIDNLSLTTACFHLIGNFEFSR
jgi:hypothetical protein